MLGSRGFPVLPWPGPMRLRRAPGLRSPPRPLGESSGLKRKRGSGDAEGGCPVVPTPPPPVESEECDACSPASGVGVARGALPSIKSESPGWSPIPGEDSFASDYSGEEDEGGTYLCPAWAIKHPIPHLVYTSAYEGDDCTGAYWADANPGDGVAMRIVKKPADTAVDPVTDEDGNGSLPLAADYGDGRTGDPQGTDDVGLCPHRLHEELGCPVVPPFPPDRLRRSPPGTPVGLRETAKYGFRVLRIGEASHPGPTDTSPGDRDYVLQAAVVAARVARIDGLVAAMRAEYQALQAERFGFVGVHTFGDPARIAPPDPPQPAPRSGAASPAHTSSADAPPSSDGGGTSHQTSHTTTSGF